MVFREGPLDGVSANLFSTHVGIANDALVRIEELTQRIARLDGAVAQDAVDRWAHEWSKSWQDAWDQLGEARAIVVRLGRDVSRFDEARAAAGDVYLDAASGRAVSVGRTTHVSWQNRSTTSARLAVAALCAVMPEVVVVGVQPVPAAPKYVAPPNLELWEAREPREPRANVFLWLGVIAVTLAVMIYAATR
jgi:hypothetical protein